MELQYCGRTAVVLWEVRSSRRYQDYGFGDLVL